MNLGMNFKPPRYVVVSPVRNESKYLETTIQSMVKQTIRPIQWVIVNDGSSDNTGEIIEACVIIILCMVLIILGIIRWYKKKKGTWTFEDEEKYQKQTTTVMAGMSVNH